MFECCRTLHIDKVLLLAMCEALFYRWDVCTYRCTAAALTSVVCLCQQFKGKSFGFLQQISFCNKRSFISALLFHPVMKKLKTCLRLMLQKRWVNTVKWEVIHKWKSTDISLLLTVNETKHSRKLWGCIQKVSASCVLILSKRRPVPCHEA